MSKQQNKLAQLKGFFFKSFSIISLNNSSKSDKLYFDVLNFQDQNMDSSTVHIQKQRNQNLQSSHFKGKMSSKIINVKKLKVRVNDFLENDQDLKQLTPQNFHRKKINPRSNKFIKLQKSLFQRSDQNGQAKVQLRQKNLKKLELKQKLKKINTQLQQEKRYEKRCQGSFESDQLNPENTFLTNLGSSQLNKSLILQNSRIRNKNNPSQFKARQKYLRNYQQAYSPQKHQMAYKLIQKFHQQKLKKQQKYIETMRKKQQKQLIILKKLQQQKTKQKMLNKSRQLLHYTPQTVYKVRKMENRFRQQSVQQIKRNKIQEIIGRQKNNSELQLKKNNKINEIQRQYKEEQIYVEVNIKQQQFQQQSNKQTFQQKQLQFSIPHEKRMQNKKLQTIYTEQFQQINEANFEEKLQSSATQQEKQFAQLLKSQNTEEIDQNEIKASQNILAI